MEDLLLLPQRGSTKDIFGNPVDSHHPPSWFNKDAILQNNFHSETYITDLTTFVPLHNLNSQLQSHHSSLNHDLVELINGDYADFVNLSTNLVDIDGAIMRIRAPLMDLRDKVLLFRDSLVSSLVELQSRLRLRDEASSARRSLEFLLDTLDVVSKTATEERELH